MNIPLLNMLLKYKNTIPLSFHVPGHRNGEVLSHIQSMFETSDYEQYFSALKKLMELDVTELSITDDLHDPQDAIEKAQQLAAHLYGVEKSFFLIGGSTAGNIASILAVCEPGDTIIVQRNAHKSVINGCKLAAVNVVFINAQQDSYSGYSTIPSIKALKDAITKYPYAKAVFLTSPNYYGISVPLDHYVQIIHESDMLLIVDEAHGAHYGFHPSLPKSAISYGADIVIQSTHKTLPSLTMTAMLHLNTSKVEANHISEQLAIIESSSPSFILLAALDLAREIMERSGQALIEQSLLVRQKLIGYLKQNNLRIAIEEYGPKEDIAVDKIQQCNNVEAQYDPLRLHLYDKEQHFTGYELQELLSKYGIWAEMATSKHCILLLHLGYTEEEYAQLIKRLNEINSAITKEQNNSKVSIKKRVSSYYNSDNVGESILMSRTANKDTKYVDLNEAVGHHSGEMLVPYPPGIPILFYNELITEHIINEINHYLEHDAKFQANETIYSRKIKIIVN